MTEILTLSGWTRHEDSLKPFLPEHAISFDYSAHAPGDAVFQALGAYKTARHVVAWSQGAQLTLRALARGVLAPEKVTLLAPSAFFVKQDTHDHAMDGFTYQTFCENYASDAARTKKRFNGLVAMGDAQQKQVMDGLIHHDEVENTNRWLPWLQDLQHQDLRGEPLENITAHVQIIHGLADGVIHPKQAEILAEKLPNAVLHLWENCAHAPHLHNGGNLLKLLKKHHAF